jgi:hypothetical protein
MVAAGAADLARAHDIRRGILTGMSPPVTVSGLDRHGVSLVSPIDPGFDEMARPLIGSRADHVFKMKPMLVVVGNDSPRTIVAMSLTWRVSKRVGGLLQRTNSVFPHVVCGDQAISRMRPGVRPGEAHVIAAGCVVENLDALEGESDSWIEHFVGERDRALEGATTVAIELDAAIFDDGGLVGANQDGWLSDLFATYVAAKQDWYRTILAGLDKGQSLDEAYAPLRTFSAESIRQMHARRPMDARERRRSMWRTQAAGEASSWLRRFPSSEVPTCCAAFVSNPSRSSGATSLSASRTSRHRSTRPASRP